MEGKIYLVLKFKYGGKVFISKLADLSVTFLVHKEHTILA